MRENIIYVYVGVFAFSIKSWRFLLICAWYQAIFRIKRLFASDFIGCSHTLLGFSFKDLIMFGRNYVLDCNS